MLNQKLRPFPALSCDKARPRLHHLHEHPHRTPVAHEFTQPFPCQDSTYRDEINSFQIQLSRTQAGPGRAVKEQQEQNSPNHEQRINLISVDTKIKHMRSCFDFFYGVTRTDIYSTCSQGSMDKCCHMRLTKAKVEGERHHQSAKFRARTNRLNEKRYLC